jgi:hypothetical protein
MRITIDHCALIKLCARKGAKARTKHKSLQAKAWRLGALAHLREMSAAKSAETFPVSYKDNVAPASQER